jgi:hypothetical protein
MDEIKLKHSESGERCIGWCKLKYNKEMAGCVEIYYPQEGI